ncbi:hypothetical protein CK203_030473 [Vitis vinifera]|uniref:Reverse transcriptase domain-containing protein n=1 Tax=Vitis vinifera TaxID=29760 RepID=A0A438JDJ2_VITVI|nr:hypothetical protein CK203_030473 [Vitis vinifera]
MEHQLVSFQAQRGCGKGTPIPLPFCHGMEVLSILIRRAMEGGFISGCKIQRDRGRAVHVAHLLFADDTIVFCEAKKEYLTNLSWILYWFEAASGLRIHLAKSEIIPVREVEEVEELAVELGCRVGHLPTVYLGLPLGVPNKAVYGWDGVEEKQVLVAKYGQEDYGWRTKKVVGACGVGVWKEILKEAGCAVQRFPHLYILAAHRNALVEDMRDQNAGEGSWNLRFIRDFNDWEVEMVGELLQVLRGFRITREEDSVCWKGGGSGQFKVKDAYNWLDRPMDVVFPKTKFGWRESQLKSCFLRGKRLGERF